MFTILHAGSHLQPEYSRCSDGRFQEVCPTGQNQAGWISTRFSRAHETPVNQ